MILEVLPVLAPAILGGLFNSIFGGSSNNSTSNATTGTLNSAANNLSPLVTQQTNFEKGLEPQREQTINDEIQQLNPAGIQSNINQFGAGALERAGDSARDLGLTNASSGIGANATAGQASNLYQNAQTQTNNYAANVNSPSARAAQLSQMLSGIQAGQTPTSLAQELQLYGPLQNTAQFNNQLNQQGNSFMNSILGGVGSVLGGGLGGDALSGIASLSSPAINVAGGTPSVYSGTPTPSAGGGGYGGVIGGAYNSNLATGYGNQ